MLTGGCENARAGPSVSHPRETPISANILAVNALAGIRTVLGIFAVSRRYTVNLCPGWPACATVPAIHAIIAIRVIVIVPSRCGRPRGANGRQELEQGRSFFLRNRKRRTIIRLPRSHA